LLDDPQARQRMGESARAATVARFSVEQTCAEMERHYDMLLTQRDKAPNR
jgi:glycosyltransferase involved in cell wall biosynthesis